MLKHGVSFVFAKPNSELTVIMIETVKTWLQRFLLDQVQRLLLT